MAIARWAELATVHILPGPAIVTALKQAANDAISQYNTSVHTEISVGHPDGDDEATPISTFANRRGSQRSSPYASNSSGEGGPYSSDSEQFAPPSSDMRKHSVVSISTTISTRSEPLSPQPNRLAFTSALGALETIDSAFERLGPIPYLRSVLLLAQMSSANNLLTPEYTAKCVEIARQHPDFVLGYIAQRSLNSSLEDNFLTLTPGVKLLEEGQSNGDGLGQQYRTPRSVILQDGSDIIIVGRGILDADDRKKVAERYRREAWKAYEDRISQ